MQAAEAAICIFEENTPMMSKRKVTTYREIRSDFTNPEKPKTLMPEAYSTKAVDDFNTL